MKLLKTLFKKEVLYYLAATLLFVNVVAFSAVSVSVSKQSKKNTAKARETALALAAISASKTRLANYNGALTYARDQKWNNGKTIQFQPLKKPDFLQPLEAVTSIQDAQETLAAVRAAAGMAEPDWKKFSAKNASTVIVANSKAIRALEELESKVAPATGQAPVSKAPFIALFFLAVISSGLIGAWGYFYADYGRKQLRAFLAGKDGQGGQAIEEFFELQGMLQKFSGGMVRGNQKMETIYSEFESVRTTIKSVIISFSELIQTADNISGSSQDLARKVVGYTDSIKNTREITGRISEDVEKVKTAAAEGSQQTEKMSATAKEGEEALGRIIDEIKFVHETVSELEQIINRLGTKTVEISKVTTLIKDIAEQTNLLALNASIEAARAGDAGRGFAVVAEEIRQLAESTGEASKRITEQIKEINKTTISTVEKINSAAERISGGVETAGDAAEAFERIKTSISDTLKISGNIYGLTAEQGQKLQDIVKIFSEVERAVEDMGANIEGISASIEQETASIENMRALMEEMKQKADAIRNSYKNLLA